MYQVTCEDVAMAMPAPLLERVRAQMIERVGVDLNAVCSYVAVGDSIDEVLDAATEHVKVEHALRSWPPEYWVHLKSRIHEV